MSEEKARYLRSERSLEHIATPAMRMIVLAAKTSFTEDELFWLSEEFDVLAHEKFRERLMADDSWTGLEEA